MAADVVGITRVVSGYDKVPDENGLELMRVEYNLKALELKFLQSIFNINPHDNDPVIRDMILCYPINTEQAKALQPYVIDGVIDLDKYDFMLECYQE